MQNETSQPLGIQFYKLLNAMSLGYKHYNYNWGIKLQLHVLQGANLSDHAFWTASSVVSLQLSHAELTYKVIILEAGKQLGLRSTAS